MELDLVSPGASKQSLLEKLPVEIKQEILGHAPDLASLSSAIRSCTSLHSAFEGHKSEIIHKVLMGQTNTYLRFETLAAGQAALFKPWSVQDTLAFLKEYWNWQFRPKYAIPRLDMPRGRLISDLYVNIRYFTDDFVKYALANHPTGKCGPKAGMWPPTRKEINRIERVFYRFQTFCDIFGDLNTRPFNSWQQQGVYFRRHAPWENEQLGCVHQYFTDKITPVFHKLVDTDKGWATYFATASEGTFSKCIEFHLSKGINHIRAILDAKSPQERNRVLGSPYSATRAEFLHELLRLSIAQEASSVRNIFARGFNSNNNPKATVCDPDFGPSQVWAWFQTFPERYVIEEECPVPLYRWGYVMWDHKRLDSWHVVMRLCRRFGPYPTLNGAARRPQDDHTTATDGNSHPAAYNNVVAQVQGLSLGNGGGE